MNDPGHIRPIVLFQAQSKNQEVTVKVLKDYLLEVERVPEEKIVVATGEQRELDGIDLFDRHCPVEYVITIEALKEGWDCSFAYVFCSVSRVRSAVDVEQLLGRVLRMPYAERRKARELNQAYAFLSEADFGEAARTLVDKLIAMGFEEDEANENIEYVQPGFEFDEGAEFPEVEETPDLAFKYNLAATPETWSALQDAEQHGVTVREAATDRIEIEVNSPIDTELEQMIYAAVPAPERSGVAEAIKSYQEQVQRRWSPARRGEVFNVPGLSTEIQSELKFADTDRLMEFHDWSLTDHPARLEKNEFAIRETARSFEIDLDGKRGAVGPAQGHGGGSDDGQPFGFIQVSDDRDLVGNDIRPGDFKQECAARESPVVDMRYQQELARGHDDYGKQVRLPAPEVLTDNGGDHAAEAGAAFTDKQNNPDGLGTVPKTVCSTFRKDPDRQLPTEINGYGDDPHPGQKLVSAVLRLRISSLLKVRYARAGRHGPGSQGHQDKQQRSDQRQAGIAPVADDQGRKQQQHDGGNECLKRELAAVCAGRIAQVHCRAHDEGEYLAEQQSYQEPQDDPDIRVADQRRRRKYRSAGDNSETHGRPPVYPVHEKEQGNTGYGKTEHVG